MRSQQFAPFVRKHIAEISRALLEGENREKFVDFLKTHEKHGLYALYTKAGELYYVGRASNLVQRLSTHTSDLHGKKWDKLAIYILDERLKLHDVESLLIAVSKPEGNTNRGRLKGDLKKELKSFMKAAAMEEIQASLYPNLKPRPNEKNRRITENKIEAFIVGDFGNYLPLSNFVYNCLPQYSRKDEWDMATAVATGFSRLSRRYKDAYGIASGTVKLGNIVKVGGLCIGALLVLLSISMPLLRFGSFFVFPGIVAGLFLGGMGFVAGTLLAAQGQVMIAVLDTAVNTSTALSDSEKLTVMGL